jgi:hypothetical protein
MTVERAELSGSLGVEQMAPVSAVPAVQGQSSRGDGEGKPRRRPPPPEETSAELSEDDSDRSPHRIDSLA